MTPAEGFTEAGQQQAARQGTKTVKLHCAGVLGGSDEMAAVVVRAEAQELVVDLVQRPGSTSPSTLPSFAQSGRGAKVCVARLPSPQAWDVRNAQIAQTLQICVVARIRESPRADRH